MSSWHLKEGDQVQVSWANNVCAVTGTLRYIPAAPGECWIVETAEGISYYIQQFEAMWRTE